MCGAVKILRNNRTKIDQVNEGYPHEKMDQKRSNWQGL